MSSGHVIGLVLAAICAEWTVRGLVQPTQATHTEMAPGTGVFGLTRAHRLHLTLSAREWEAMQETRRSMPSGAPGGQERSATGQQQGRRDVHHTDFMEFPRGTRGAYGGGQPGRGVARQGAGDIGQSALGTRGQNYLPLIT